MSADHIVYLRKMAAADNVFTWEDGGSWPHIFLEMMAAADQWPRVPLGMMAAADQVFTRGRWRLLTKFLPEENGSCWPHCLPEEDGGCLQRVYLGRWRLLTTCLLYLWRMVAASYSLVWICRPGWDQPIGGVGDGVAVYSSPKQNAVLVGAVDLHQY